MIGLLSLGLASVCSAQTYLPVQKDFSVDLFLVGNNVRRIENTYWLDKGDVQDPAERLLRDACLKVSKAQGEFVVIDGGDLSLFPATLPLRSTVITRTCAPYIVAIETHPSPRKTVTKFTKMNVEPNTGICSVVSEPPTPSRRYKSWVCMNLTHTMDPGEALMVQDLNSYLTSLHSGQAQDKQTPGTAMIVSGGSIYDSVAAMGSDLKTFDGLCFCTWGLNQRDHPNFIVFPPAGVVAHYKLTRSHQKLSARLIQYLGHPDRRS